MGYRSDVGMAFYAMQEDKVGVVKLWLRENLPFKDWDEDDFEETKDGYKFYVSDVKWYESFPEVHRFYLARDKFVEIFCDIDPHAACEFVRVGEQDDDIEVERGGDHEFRLSVSKQICFD